MEYGIDQVKEGPAM